MSPAGTWLYAAGIAMYTVVAALYFLVLKRSSGFVIAIPALAIAMWMGYVYWRYRDSGSHWGVAINGVGWLVIAMAFMIRDPLWLRKACSVAGIVAIVCAGIFAMLETRSLEATSPRADEGQVESTKEEAPRADAAPSESDSHRRANAN